MLLTSCAVILGENENPVGKAFLGSVAGKKMCEPGDEIGRFSDDGVALILLLPNETYVYSLATSKTRAVYYNITSDKFYAIQYGGGNSRYWKTENFTGPSYLIRIE